MITDNNIFTQVIKAKALELGFDDCGVACVEYYPELENHFRWWLEQGYAGQMEYMSQTANFRANVKSYFPEARSVIVLVASYLVEDTPVESRYKVAKFAKVSDYHYVLKSKLQELIGFLEIKSPGSKNIYSVDAQPVAERFWAVKAGLGFLGLNSMFIHPKFGSHVFLCTVITSIELTHDELNTESCYSCGKCIESCPNNAIVKPFFVDARKCISYLTIEYRGDFDETNPVVLNSYLFGCDICNDVCPHNADVRKSNNKLFHLKKHVTYSEEEWEQMGSAQFKRELSSTPLRRAGLRLLRRNIRKIKREK